MRLIIRTHVLFLLVYLRRTDNVVKNRFLLYAKGGPRMNIYSKKMVHHVPMQMIRGILAETGCVTPSAVGSSLPIKQMRYVKYQQRLVIYAKRLTDLLVKYCLLHRI